MIAPMKDYEKIEGKFRFYGYIAYTHDNYSEAKKLHKFLESYKLDFVLGKKNKENMKCKIDTNLGFVNRSKFNIISSIRIS